MSNWPHVFGTQYPSVSLSWLDDQFNQISGTATATISAAGANIVGYTWGGVSVPGTTAARLNQTLSVKDPPFNAKGDGSTNDDAAFTAVAALGQPYYVPYTSNFYNLTANPTGKAFGPGLIKVNGSYFAIPQSLNMTGAVWMGRNDNTQGSWFVVGPDGTLVNTSGTTTQGLQEGINYAGNNGFNFKLEGGQIDTGVGGTNYATITCANNLNPVLQFPTMNQSEFDLGTVMLILQPQTATNDGIAFDTWDVSRVIIRGQIVYEYPGSGTFGSAIRFNPTNDNGETFIGGTNSSFELGSVVVANTSKVAITTQGIGIRFSTNNGSIITSEVKVQEINGGLVGLQVDNPGATHSFQGNTFKCPSIHNNGSDGIVVGTTATTSIYKNQWEVVVLPNATGIITYAVKDRYFGTVYGGTVGIQFGSSADGCMAFLSDIGGGIVDNSTANTNKVFKPLPRTSTSITPSGSPYTYKNVDAVEEVVVVQGGTVSGITYNGVVTGIGTNSLWTLQPGESIVVTYTGTPTMSKIY